MRSRGGASGEIGEALLAQAHQMFTWWHRVREGRLARSTFRSYMTPLRREVERLLEAGSQCGVGKTEGTCWEILKRRQALWTFVQVDGVEPTNNTAERAIRPGVQWRKASSGTQSEAGSRFVESMMTRLGKLLPARGKAEKIAAENGGETPGDYEHAADRRNTSHYPSRNGPVPRPVLPRSGV